MNGVLRGRLVAACALMALALGPAAVHATAHADAECTRDDARSAAGGEAEGGPAASTPESNAIAAEAAHTLPTVTVESRALPPPAPHRSFWPARFVDHFVDHFDFGTRLRAIRRLKIVPVFDNARVTIFLGVDRRGVAGLHIQQQDASDLQPLLARQAPYADAPPLRALPPRLP
jgi:hypothetical protein